MEFLPRRSILLDRNQCLNAIPLAVFSFFRRKKPLLPVPGWAGFFTQAEFNEFLGLVEAYFKGKKVTHRYEDGVIITADKDQEEFTHGLLTVAQHCKQLPPEEWKQLIETHFSAFEEIDRFNAAFSSKAHDYEYARQYLGVRLYGDDCLQVMGEDVIITRSVMEGIVAMLVFDFPHSINTVKPTQSILWSRSEDELFKIGAARMKANYPVEISHEKVDGLDIWMVTGDHFFSPNIILEMKERPSFIGTYGSLVGVPHRHAVLVYPIETLQVIEATHKLIPLLNYMYEQGPGSISRQLYWYYDNTFHRLPYTLEERALQFSPPGSFIDMLNAIK